MMLEQLPVATRPALLLVGLMLVGLPSAGWLAVPGYRRDERVVAWFGGGVVAGSGLVVMALDSGPSLLTRILAETAVAAGLFLEQWSLDAWVGRRRPVRAVAWQVAACVTSFWLLAGHPWLLELFQALVFAGAALGVSVAARRVFGSVREPGAALLVVVHAVVALAWAWRGTVTAVTPAAAGAGTLPVLAAGFLVAATGSLSFVGLVLDHAQRQEVVRATNRARTAERDRLRHRMSEVEQQRSVGVVAASLAHELSQPLAAILTNAQSVHRLAGRSDLANFDLDAPLRAIDGNAARATQLLARLARIAPDHPDHTRETCDPFRVLDSVLPLVDVILTDTGVTLTIERPQPPVTVAIHPVPLSQALVNAVRNACEAMAGSTRRQIRIDSVLVPGSIALRVTDSGTGLPSQAPTPGTPFFTTKPQGLGVGIAVSRAGLAAAGGTYLLTPAAHGGGTVVTIRLPLAGKRHG